MKSEEQRLSSFLNRALSHAALYSWAAAVAGPVVAAGVVTMLTAGAALAQSSAAAHVYDTSHTIPTAIKGVTTFAAPPAGFDAVKASDQELAAYGLPPRPDATVDAANYAKWAKAMATPTHRSSEPLRATDLKSTEMKSAGQPRAAAAGTAAATAASSYNWSGVVNTVKGLTSWNAKKSIYYVVSDFNVPVAQQAFGGTCDGGWDLQVSWNGIDGWSNGDVLQGGSLSGAYCSGGSTTTDYYAWIEWYPSYSILYAFNVNPGDDLFVETWDTSSTNGYVYVADLTLGVSGTYNLTPTTTPYLVGNSAEYIVERPCCRSGNYYPLANYVQDFWAENYAYPFTGAQLYAGSTATTTYQVTMLDDSGTQDISTPVEIGPKYQIFFEDEACANYGGCTP